MFGFFKSKKEFDRAVQEEVNRREQKQKKEVEKNWDKWLEEHPVNVNYSKKNEARILYTDAEKLHKEGKDKEALAILNAVMEKLTDLGEIIGLYVFILLIDVQNNLEGMSGALWAYDLGIKYYSGISGEYTDKWKEHLVMARESYIREAEMLQDMKSRYNFELKDELIPALQRLESLKVNECRYDDYASQNSFDAIWISVLHEVDLYEEGEESMLNKNSCRGAKNWLKSFSHLCKMAKIPEEYKLKEGQV